jgi:hypothetical protein
MHGVKSHPFDNFPSFCFSFSSCPHFGELAKNIAQMLPCPQLIFPSKTWFFGILFEFSAG